MSLGANSPAKAMSKRGHADEGQEERTAKRTRNEKKDPKASHLYTDDNPETTLHGTGFKDTETAEKTIRLVSNRSLTYQQQTINTMLYRAKGHKSKTPGIKGAITVFDKWVKSYKEQKASLRDFKLLPKPVVKDYLEKYDNDEFDIASDRELEDAIAFARVYSDLGPRKRLANTLVDQKRPDLEDWEVRRYKHLCELVSEEAEYDADELWADEAKKNPTNFHLKLIFWGYSPVKKLYSWSKA